MAGVRVRWPVLLAAALLLTACGASEAAPAPTAPFGTVPGVGEVPRPLSSVADMAGASTTSTSTSTTEARDTVARPDDLGPIGDRVAGNRLMIIGDSIVASTARRYGGEMCFTLLPLGWAVEVNAEVARFVDFGHRVLDRRLRPDEGVDWDAAVVFLGSNYGGDVSRFRSELHGILDRLAPRPTVLVTVTEFRSNRSEVNEVIRGMLDFYTGVDVLDWAELTRTEPGLLSGDGLHLSPDGRARLAGEIALTLGPAPAPADVDGDVSGDVAAGECLSTSFTDDSAGARPGAATPPPTLVAGGGGGGGSGGGASATTSTTTTASAPTTSSSAPTGGSGAGTSATTGAPTTVSSTTSIAGSTAAPMTTVASTTTATTTTLAPTGPTTTGSAPASTTATTEATTTTTVASPTSPGPSETTGG